jgi:hypothetical protein
MNFPFGWIGNAIILCGAWQLAHKNRRAFLFYTAGSLCWIVEASLRWEPDLLTIESVMLFVTIRNYLAWRKQ